MSDKKYSSIKHENAAGRVEFSGGKAVWQWDQDANDSTSILIKSLDNPDLELEVTRRTPVAGPQQKAHAGQKQKSTSASGRRPPRDDAQSYDWDIPDGGGSGFDPYNSG